MVSAGKPAEPKEEPGGGTVDWSFMLYTVNVMSTLGEFSLKTQITFMGI